MSISVDCPSCHTSQDVGEELIGRYTLCRKCGCRFYVVVPPLGEQKADEKSSIEQRPPKKSASAAENELTVSDLFWDSQKGEAVIVKLLRDQQRLMARMSWMQAITVACAIACAAMLAWMLWRS